MKIIWSVTANLTFQQELDYILKKWSKKEVSIFSKLVDSNLEQLKTFPTIGKPYKNKKRSLVISKQTTLFYKFNNEDENTIELLLFWNNQWNPKDLKKLL